MAVQEQKTNNTFLTISQTIWPWLSLGVTAVLIIAGFWYLTSKVSLADMGQALTQANIFFIILSLTTMLLTIVLKVIRWRFLLAPNSTPLPFHALFWAVMLGQYVNTVVPFLRLGEITRVYALNYQTGVGKIRSLGTLVVEKTVELIFLTLTILILLPFIILPDFINNSGIPLGAAAAVALAGLYFLAYQPAFVTRLTQKATSWLPNKLERLTNRLVISGLEGLTALRNQRLSAIIVLLSLLIAVLSVATPYLLFPAFGIKLGLVQAALIHIATSIASTPPSTPGKIGVFDGVVAFMLISFGLTNDATLISYTIIFHLVIILPKIVLGGIAASRTNWQWRSMRAAETH